MNRRISVRGIAVHNGKLLCVRLKRDGSFWCLPGGGLDEGETLLDGVHREMVEETGIAPIVGDLLYVQQFAHEEKDYLEFFFHITNAADYLAVDLTKTTHGTEEIEEINFIDPATSTILPEFLTTEPLATIISSPTKLFARY